MVPEPDINVALEVDVQHNSPASPYSESPLHEEPVIISPSTDEPETSSLCDLKIKSVSTSDEQEVEELAPQILCEVKGKTDYPLKPAIKKVVYAQVQRW